MPYSDKLADGILKLSEIMRYALRQPFNSNNEKVALTDEIDHIRNIIEINRLRFNDHIFIQFEVNGSVEGVYILPLVLITVIENVFKHGEINNPKHPATIRITVNNAGIKLYCYNKIKGGIKEPGTGIGLENTRQRLEYEYGSNFSLQSYNEKGYNTTEMSIDFHPTKNLIK